MQFFRGTLRGIREDNQFDEPRYIIGIFGVEPDGFGGNVEKKFEVMLRDEHVKVGMQSSLLQYRDKVVEVPVALSCRSGRNNAVYTTYYLAGDVVPVQQKPAVQAVKAG